MQNIRVCDLLLKSRYCLTQNDSRQVIEDSVIAIANGQVAAIGPASEMRAWQAGTVRDLGNALVMPGLVNSHTHVAMTFLRGLGDDMPLMEWLEKRIFPAESKVTAEMVQLGSLLGFAEMLASGTTSCLDMYYFTASVFRAARESGIRCVAGEAALMFPNPSCKSWKESLELMSSLAADLAGQNGQESRLGLAVSPHAVYTTTPEILTACRDFAEANGLPLHIHLSETADETRRCLEAHGKRPVAFCNDLGLLDLPVTLAHVVDVTEDELDLLASKPYLAVAHNPSSNMKLASGVAPVRAMLERGIAVGLGTDGAASNNCLNMFAEMRQCALMHKLVHLDPTVLPAQTVLDMATSGGIACLHDKAVSGRLLPGARADLVVLDLGRPNLVPMYDPASHLVYAANGSEVVMTMVDGEVLYENGKFSRFDYSALCQEMEKLRAYVHALVS